MRVSASARVRARVHFPRASANGKRGKSFNRAERILRNVSTRSLLNSGGVTFCEHSEVWLEQSQNRKRKPIGQSYAVTIQGALDK